MNTQPETLIFHPDPVKRRRHLLGFWGGFLTVITTIFLTSTLLPEHHLLFVIPLLIWQLSMHLLGIDNPFRHRDEVIITRTALKGASLQRAGRAYLMLENLMLEPTFIKRNSPKWLQSLYPSRVWISINYPKTPYGFKIDISLLSTEDQQTVLTTLQQRYQASMSP